MLRTRFFHWLSIAFLWALSLVPVAHAEGRAKESSAYSEAVRVGLQEFEDRNFAEARAHFLRAHALAPSARTLRALGMVEFELKHYAESARLLTEALGSREKALDPDKRAHAQELLTRAEGYIGTITLDMAPGTAVVVDGVTTNLSAGRQLALEVGDHTLEFSAAGHIAQKRALTIRGGERDTLRVGLVPLEAQREVRASQVEQPARAPTSDASSPKERRALKSPWLWTAIGLVVAGAATGAAIALTRHDPAAKVREPYTGSGGAPALGTAP
jgi:hypothetical protein